MATLREQCGSLARAFCARDQHAEGTDFRPNVGPQACSVGLQIATQHTEVFMTVLTLVVLSPRSVGERKCMMQLVALLLHKVSSLGL